MVAFLLFDMFSLDFFYVLCTGQIGIQSLIFMLSLYSHKHLCVQKSIDDFTLVWTQKSHPDRFLNDISSSYSKDAKKSAAHR